MVATETGEILLKWSIVFANVVSFNSNEGNFVLNPDLNGPTYVDNVSCNDNGMLTIGRTLRFKVTRIDFYAVRVQKEKNAETNCPSPCRGNYMIITCKTINAVYQNVGIKEENPHASNTFTKCTTAKLVFENLNELIITYLMAYSKFKYGDHSVLSDYLGPTTRPNPKMGLFALCLNDYV